MSCDWSNGDRLFVAALVLSLLLGIGLVPSIPHGDHAHQFDLMEDEHTLRRLSIQTVELDRIPVAPDGRIDVYAVLDAWRWNREECEVLCRSVRLDRGATWAQIEARNFDAFPWARGFPPPARGPQRHPLLWEANPDRNGKRLVAFVSGEVELLSSAAFGELVR